MSQTGLASGGAGISFGITGMTKTYGKGGDSAVSGLSINGGNNHAPTSHTGDGGQSGAGLVDISGL